MQIHKHYMRLQNAHLTQSAFNPTHQDKRKKELDIECLPDYPAYCNGWDKGWNAKEKIPKGCYDYREKTQHIIKPRRGEI